jgi:hypothetical protein
MDWEREIERESDRERARVCLIKVTLLAFIEVYESGALAFPVAPVVLHIGVSCDSSTELNRSLY